jgi:hypothetical protein
MAKSKVNDYGVDTSAIKVGDRVRIAAKNNGGRYIHQDIEATVLEVGVKPDSTGPRGWQGPVKLHGGKGTYLIVDRATGVTTSADQLHRRVKVSTYKHDYTGEKKWFVHPNRIKAVGDEIDALVEDQVVSALRSYKEREDRRIRRESNEGIESDLAKLLSDRFATPSTYVSSDGRVNLPLDTVLSILMAEPIGEDLAVKRRDIFSKEITDRAGTTDTVVVDLAAGASKKVKIRWSDDGKELERV